MCTRVRVLALTAFVLAALGTACQRTPPVSEENRERAERYLAAVREHADTILEHGRDTYGKPTPLIVDGLVIDTFEPVRWHFDEHEWILSNFANQQELMRTLCGLSILTGDRTYKNAAIETTRYVFDHLGTPNGLLMWGGHLCYDAGADQWAGRRFHWPAGRNAAIHELKSIYPDYEFMAEVDRDATTQFIRSFWAAHIKDWATLDFDRHGGITKPKPKGREIWEHTGDPDAPVHFRGRGRTFVNTGSDLYYAAAMLWPIAGDMDALIQATELVKRYVQSRHPETGLRSYHFSSPDEVDRLEAQIGDLFPDSEVRETHFFNPNTLPGPLLMQLRMVEQLGERGRRLFLDWTIEDLTAIGKLAYIPEQGAMRVMLIDGTDLTGISLPRDGYFGKKGTVFAPGAADDYFLVYAAASRLSEDPFMWEMARNTARDSGLGDIGDRDQIAPSLNENYGKSRHDHLVGMLELYRLTRDPVFLDQACRIGDSILENRFENGLFTPGPNYIHTRTSRPEPLALIHLAAALLHREDDIPPFPDSDPYFACEHKSTDKTYSFDRAIYVQKRE